MVKIVLDTNGLVSALLKPDSVPDLIISRILENRLVLCLTDPILAEYEEVLAREKFKRLNRSKVKSLLGRLKDHSFWVEPKIRLEVTKLDPEDNKFLECALAAQADFLITGNTMHFPPKRFKKTLIASPTEFLSFITQSLGL